MNFKNILETLTFDDVLLAPRYSEISSRQEVDISTRILGLDLRIPIISSPMDTVTEVTMAKKMEELGGLGILHRYAKPETVCSWIDQLKYPVPSVGVNSESHEAAILYHKRGVKRILIDVAHGHTKQCADMIKFLRDTGYDYVMAGNVATRDGAQFLARAGATDIRVGIGGGSVCETRIVSGHGIPQLQAIDECSFQRKDKGFTVIADGGIRNSGDAVKALAAGADAIMLGHMLSTAVEAPLRTDGEGRRIYRGMASKEAQLEWREKVGNNTAEGTFVPLTETRPLSEILNSLAGGIRSGFSYSGARNLKEFQMKAEFIRITGSGMQESKPHAVKSNL